MLKLDLSQQVNNGKMVKVEYEDDNAYAHAKQIVASLKEKYFNKLPIMGFEKQPPPGFADGDDGYKKKRSATKKPHQHLLISQLIYSMLSEMGVECYWLNPKEVREYFGTFSVGNPKDDTNKKKYDSSKERSKEKFKELIGERVTQESINMFGSKLDDVADAFLLCLYLKENYEEIKKKKENNQWREFKSKARKKPSLQKKFKQLRTSINPEKLKKRLLVSHEKVPILKQQRLENKRKKKIK